MPCCLLLVDMQYLKYFCMSYLWDRNTLVPVFGSVCSEVKKKEGMYLQSMSDPEDIAFGIFSLMDGTLCLRL